MSKIPRIYQSEFSNSSDLIDLSESASHHLNNVLRMKTGEKLIVFSGDNREFDAIISAMGKKRVQVSVRRERQVSRESACRIHLLQSISKGERMELIVQKAVELGVFSITPLISARTVVKLDQHRMEKKIAQWKAIAIAACEQSGRNQLPKINTMLTLEEYLKAKSLKDQFPLVKFVLDPKTSKSWRDYTDYATKEKDIALLIGPEGGFNQEEMEAINFSGFYSLSLGPRILRTETAALVGLSVLQAVWGDI